MNSFILQATNVWNTLSYNTACGYVYCVFKQQQVSLTDQSSQLTIPRLGSVQCLLLAINWHTIGTAF